MRSARRISIASSAPAPRAFGERRGGARRLRARVLLGGEVDVRLAQHSRGAPAAAQEGLLQPPVARGSRKGRVRGRHRGALRGRRRQGGGLRHSGGGRDRRISVLRVDLKTGAVPERALAAITQAVPRKLLLVCCHEGRARLAAMRYGLQVGAQWVPEDQLHITLFGASLAEVWEGLCAQVLFDDASVEDVDARLAKEKRIQELEAQAAQLKRKYAKEVQPSKRNAAFKAYKQAKAELSLLKGE
ncbi:MAG: DUF4391 domain-containing protein [Collinsella intestinalis]